MNVFIVGSGGREHALAWKLRQSRHVTSLYCAPGNPGIGEVAEIVHLKATDLAGLAAFAHDKRIDLTVVGPEQPLADGISDLFESRGLQIFGPSRRAAELEWSKAFAKEFMQRYHIPTAAHRTFRLDQDEAAHEYARICPLPVVLKADGLAAGKGVIICATRGEAVTSLDKMIGQKAFGSAGETVVFEEFLSGTEASVFAICDGKEFVTLAPAQDHKRVFDGDRGKNTGGMGAYAPAPMVTREILRQVEETIIAPTLRGMAAEDRPYRGCLYVGLMLTAEGPKVVEYNCRFGDPETQVVLPLYAGDLFELLLAAACRTVGSLNLSDVTTTMGNAVCVVLASGGYPDSYAMGIEILGLGEAGRARDIIVFHAGTKAEGTRILTSGGRVLGVTAVEYKGTLRTAIDAAYDAVGLISFEGMHFRHDIGAKALRGEVAYGSSEQTKGVR
jgi:phosphoribosylamine--glycine ligase